MPDTIGTISVPEVSPSGVFPLNLEFGMVTHITPQPVVHTFAAGNAKREQRFQLGPNLRTWELDWELTESDLDTLIAFWEARKGAYQPFTFNAPNPDQTTTAYTAAFENAPISWDHQQGYMAQLPLRLREVATGSGPVHTVNATVERFPSSALATALTGQVHEIIPLVKIQTRKPGSAAIYVSDRRCTIGGQLYQARLLNRPRIRQVANGVPGAVSEPDDVTFVFGNADKVMRDLVFSVMLDFASVEYSLFHVATGIKLDLWAGEVRPKGWELDGLEFRLSCTDLLSNPFRIFPNRSIDRKCQNAFDKGRCTFSADGTLDGAYPEASGSSCDKGFWTPNGCTAHGMQTRYQGVPLTPQPFRTKDNSGNFFSRLIRSTLVQNSQIAEGALGQPLPFIFTDEPMRVPAIPILGVDQGDFYNAIGVVGQGPLGGYAPGHTLDGQPHHGPGPSGLREFIGQSPAQANAFVSLDYDGNQVNSDPQKVYSGNSTFLNQFSAGLAFIGIKRSDQKGIQYTRLEEHAMEAVVAEGLSGWKWDGGGSRSSVVLTNPVWVAANVLLWGLFEELNSSAAQLGRIHLASCVAAANICDASVTKLVGSGSETQFKFNGRISDRRPLRDHIADILANGLGYYYWVFGKLAIGIRSNSSAVAAFTDGNVLLNSAKPSAPRRDFNRFTGSFAERATDGVTGEVQMIPNTATFEDEDFAVELGGGQVAYLQAETNLSGTNNISQASRVVNIRGREEVGGVNEAQRLAAVDFQLGSTILALDVAPGDVVSYAGEGLPSSMTLEFRVAEIEYLDDYSVILRGAPTTDDIYDLVAGTKPADVLPDSVPPESFPIPGRPVWHPNAVVPPAGDPLYAAGDNTFGLAQRYVPKADGGKQAVVDVTGVEPVTGIIPDSLSPIIREWSTGTGESLEEGETYFISVCGRDTDGLHTPPSNIVPITLGAGESQIVLDAVEWPAHPSGGSFEGYTLFAAKRPEASCAQIFFTGTLPGSIDFDGPLQPSTWGMPNRKIQRVVVKAKEAIHLGILGEQLTAIEEVTPSSVTIAAMAGFSEDVEGRVLCIIAKYTGDACPLLNFTITTQNHTTGELTLSPDPVAAGVEAGDLAVIRLQAGIASATTIGDTLIANTIYPNGLDATADPDREKGLIVRITAGLGRGQWRGILSYTDDTYTVDRPWDTIPDATSVFIVEGKEWRHIGESSEIANTYSDVPITISLPVGNLIKQPFVIGAFLRDRDGLETTEDLIPVRDGYLWGRGLNTRIVTADTALGPDDQVIQVDTTAGDVVITLPAAESAKGRGFYIQKISDDGNIVTVSAQTSETIGVFGAGAVQDRTITVQYASIFVVSRGV